MCADGLRFSARVRFESIIGRWSEQDRVRFAARVFRDSELRILLPNSEHDLEFLHHVTIE